MYFACGWPKVLPVEPLGDGDQVVYISLDVDHMVIVTRSIIQLWTGGQNHIRLGRLARDSQSLEADGDNVKAFWCSSRRQLAVVTAKSCLHLYGIHYSKDLVLQISAAASDSLPDLRRVDIYLQHSLQVDHDGALTRDLVADSRCILLGLSDGSFQLYSWQGKLRGWVNLFVNSADIQLRRHLPRGASLYAAVSLRPAPSVSGPLRQHSALPMPQQLQQQLPVQASQLPNSAAVPIPDAPAQLARSSLSSSSELPALSPRTHSALLQAHEPGPIAGLDYAPSARVLTVVLVDGRVGICRVSEHGLYPAEQIEFSHWVCQAGSGACCAKTSAAAQLVAVGLESGEVALYRLHGSAVRMGGKYGGGSVTPPPLRVMSLIDWGYAADFTGGVAALQWSADNRAIAVGWAHRGMALWSPSGCRLMCSLRQSPRSATSPRHDALHNPLQFNHSNASVASARNGATLQRDSSGSGKLFGGPSSSAPPLEGGCTVLAWDPHGYRLMVSESGSAAQVLQLGLARRGAGNHRVVHSDVGRASLHHQTAEEVHYLMADDRLLLIYESPDTGDAAAAAGSRFAFQGAGEDAGTGAGPGLVAYHLRLPQHYISANYPLKHAALSGDGLDVAVAGTRGLALYSRRSARWRLFGDVSQEREISVQSLLWLTGIVVACATSTAASKGARRGSAADLLLYPRYHLNNSSLLARFPLQQVPLAMDAVHSYLVVATAPLEIRLLHVTLHGALTPLGQPSASLQVVRELSIMSVGSPLQDIALVAEQSGPGAEGRSVEPRSCVLLRTGGLMSVFDLDQGSETTLADDVECFWLTGPAPGPPGNAAGTSGLGAGGSGAGGGFPDSGVADESVHGGSVYSLDSQPPSVHGGSAWSSPQGARLQGSYLPAMPGKPPGMPPGALRRALQSVSEARVGPCQGGGAGDESSSDAGSTHAGKAPPAGQLGLRQSSGLEEGAPAEAAAGTSASGGVEIPWWTYGARGMQLWFPSSLPGPLSINGLHPHVHQQHGTDPELEFDPEVYPIGISLAEVAIVGVTQRVVRTGGGLAYSPQPQQSCWPPHSACPCFHPVPESQPVLPCLLRRLLQKAKVEDALTLAQRHSQGPNFARSLEWLLFTSLEADDQASELKSSVAHVGVPNGADEKPTANGFKKMQAGPLLQAAAQLIRQFPQFRDIVVSVARKTDAQLWPALFQATGAPAALLNGLLDAGELQSAACCLLIVDRIQGAAVAQRLALSLIKAALAEDAYELAAELLRFLIPPSRHDCLHAPNPLDALGLASSDDAAASSSEPAAAGTSDRETVEPAAEAYSYTGWFLSWFWKPLPAAAPPTTHSADGSSEPGDDQGLLEGASAGKEAWRLMGSHAWELLSAGSLRSLAHLGRALAPVGAGLPSLMAAAKPEPASPPNAADFMTALAAAARELPVYSDEDVAPDAALLIEFCQGAGPAAAQWTAALALLLDNMPALAAVAAEHPAAWAEFAALVRRDPQLSAYWDSLAAVDALCREQTA